MNLAAALVAAAFAFSAVYYIALRQRASELGAAWAHRSRPPSWQVPLELARTLVVAVAVAGLVALIEITDPVRAAALGLALWIAFPVVLLIGSVTQENTPVLLAVIHAGDWLAKLLIVALITSAWR